MAERGWQDHEMLHAGALLGLGVHEHWDNFENKQYSAIEYIEIDLDNPQIPDITVADSVAPISDLQIPFGNVTEGNSSDQAVTIANEGNANLSIGNIAQANELADPFSIINDACSGKSIMPAANCTFTVRFLPTTVGSYNDSFDVPSNDPDENPVTVVVSGTGLQLVINNLPSIPQLVYPADGQMGLGTTITLRWKKSTDPDGDIVTYDLFCCENQDFIGCTPVHVAFIDYKNSYYAGTLVCLLLFGLVNAGSGRRRKVIFIIAVIVIASMLVFSCGDGGGDDDESGNGQNDVPDEISYTLSGLNSNTLYYWKIIAKDDKGGEVSSSVWSFTTQ
jgi:hypothetical protein